jgi:hypothetical protein
VADHSIYPQRCDSFSRVLVSAPLVAALTHTKGRLTFGEAGPLNYVRLVGHEVPHYSLPLDFWAGKSSAGLPSHAPRQVLEHPLILRIDGPVKATLPFWYDPSYWTDGLQVHFDARKQFEKYLQTLGVHPMLPSDGISLPRMSLNWLPMFGGVLALVGVGLRIRPLWSAMRRQL